jgi:hypothetical protein
MEIIRREESIRWLCSINKYESQISFNHGAGKLTKDAVADTCHSVSGKTGERLLNDLWEEISVLDIREPFEVLINNRELIPIRNNEDLILAVRAFKDMALKSRSKIPSF